MKPSFYHFSLSAVLMASLSVASAQAGSGDAGGEHSVESIISAVKTAQNDQIQMSNFLQRFGVEVAREQNMQMSGSIQGSLNGSIGGISLGNVPALAEGILGLGAEAASIASPFGALAVGLSPVSSLLRGLSGMGFMDGSMSGELSGSMQGSGYQINNEAHSFLVVGKNRAAFNPVVYAKQNSSKLNITDTSTLNILISVLNNPYIVDDGEVAQFNHLKTEFRDTIHNIDSLVADNISSNNKVFDRAKGVSDSLKDWARTKRVTFAMAGKGPIPLEKWVVVCPKAGLAQENIQLQLGYDTNTQLDCQFLLSDTWKKQIDEKVTCINEGKKWYTSAIEVESSQYYEVRSEKEQVSGVDGSVTQALFDPKNMDIQTDEYLFF
jgi:hypothetical protein